MPDALSEVIAIGLRWGDEAENLTPEQPLTIADTDGVPPAIRAPGGRIRALAAALVEPGGRYAGPFESFILALIVLSVASVVVEAIPGLPGWARCCCALLEIFVVVVFSVEYLLRIAVARSKLRFILSFQGVVDLLSIAPFYIADVDTRWLRLLRMLRLLRVLKLRTHVLENR